MNSYKNELDLIAQRVCESNAALPGTETSYAFCEKNIEKLCELMRGFIFPMYFCSEQSYSELSELLFKHLTMLITEVYSFVGKKGECDSEQVALDVMKRIPDIHSVLLKDAMAIYEGDPAATSVGEVILCYPGFLAITIYRLAHELYVMRIPLLSRFLTEFAHSKTGIDIHAGATIGEYFCIDHGTGIVIGETTVIGNRVKIYQGVTLGAKSFELDDDGNPVKGIKRHPNIEDNCIIYANATILGGNTTVGRNCTIGANVWITSSVEENSVVYYGENKRKKQE